MGFLRRYLRLNAFRKGVLGNSRFWLWIFVASQVLKLRAKLLGKEERVVFRHALEPGETLVIAHDRQQVEAS
jgi:hypothetical protein